MTIEGKQRFDLTVISGDKPTFRAPRIFINKNSSFSNKRLLLMDEVDIIFPTVAIFFYGGIAILPAIICMGCCYPNRLYRMGFRWACIYNRCSNYYPLFKIFYSSRRNYLCYFGDCCGFCTHGSCPKIDVAVKWKIALMQFHFSPVDNAVFAFKHYSWRISFSWPP